ncbi:MAG TPA: DUF898 family protein [Promicromonospora sp.]|uniref:DUF898 domain-containing protein n=1 Tax=Actinotalea caeni TaxID=1348467 RepID=UPI001F04F4A2|nr:DUF898 domain-containing protein [Actinotalea caeni]HEV6953557.1 DUF898 family protein [Promicromonospora sp.]
MSVNPSQPQDRAMSYPGPHQSVAPGSYVPAVSGPSGAPMPIQPAPHAPLFGFDGGAATWFGVQLGGFLITLLTAGICYPWAVVMTYRWKTKHTYLQGRRLRFTGTAFGLFGHWIKWLLLMVVTLGIYSFWVYPRLTKWIVEHQELDPVG